MSKKSKKSKKAKEITELYKPKGKIVIPQREVRTATGNWIDMSLVTARKVKWLWYPYIPMGYFTNLVGMGSAGKSSLVGFLASQISTGRPFLPGMEKREPGSVLIIEDEQGEDTGVKPQLDANGADSSKVIYLESINLVGGVTGHMDVTEYCCVLEDALESEQDVQLIVFDPLSSYMGNTNTNDNTQVRQGLHSLQKMVKRWEVALIAINHFGKNEERSSENRSLGSVAFYNLARSEILIHEEKTDQLLNTGKRYMGLNKGNFVKENNPPTLSYYLRDLRVDFDPEPDDRSIANIIRKSKTKKGPKRKDGSENFMSWLKHREGSVQAKLAKKVGKNMGVSDSRISVIAKEAGYDTNGRGNNGMWVKSRIKDK